MHSWLLHSSRLIIRRRCYNGLPDHWQQMLPSAAVLMLLRQ
jgi:hypothetical protein